MKRWTKPQVAKPEGKPGEGEKVGAPPAKTASTAPTPTAPDFTSPSKPTRASLRYGKKTVVKGGKDAGG